MTIGRLEITEVVKIVAGQVCSTSTVVTGGNGDSLATHDEDAPGTKCVDSQAGEGGEDALENKSGDSQITVGDGDTLLTNLEAGEGDEDALENKSGDSQITVGDGDTLSTNLEDALVIGGDEDTLAITEEAALAIGGDGDTLATTGEVALVTESDGDTLTALDI